MNTPPKPIGNQTDCHHPAIQTPSEGQDSQDQSKSLSNERRAFLCKLADLISEQLKKRSSPQGLSPSQLAPGFWTTETFEQFQRDLREVGTLEAASPKPRFFECDDRWYLPAVQTPKVYTDLPALIDERLDKLTTQVDKLTTQVDKVWSTMFLDTSHDINLDNLTKRVEDLGERIKDLEEPRAVTQARFEQTVHDSQLCFILRRCPLCEAEKKPSAPENKS